MQVPPRESSSVRDQPDGDSARSSRQFDVSACADQPTGSKLRSEQMPARKTRVDGMRTKRQRRCRKSYDAGEGSDATMKPSRVPGLSRHDRPRHAVRRAEDRCFKRFMTPDDRIISEFPLVIPADKADGDRAWADPNMDRMPPRCWCMQSSPDRRGRGCVGVAGASRY